MSDQELDNLFKDAAAKTNQPYDDNDWSKMAALLDQANGAPAPTFWNWKTITSGIVSLAILGSMVVWNGSRNNVASDAPLHTVNDQNSVQPDKTKLTAKINSEAVAATDDLNSAPVNSFQDVQNANENNALAKSNASHLNGSSEGKNKEGSGKKKRENQIIRAVDTNTRFASRAFDSLATTECQWHPSNSNQNLVGLTKENEHRNTNIDLTKDGNQVDKIVATSLTVTKESTSAKQNVSSSDRVNDSQDDFLSHGKMNRGIQSDTTLTTSRALTKNDITVNDTASLIMADSGAEKISAEKINSTQQEENLVNEKISSSKWSVKLALSPDFSSIGIFTPGKIGVNYGLMAEYDLNLHWSLSAGAIWSRKLYATEEGTSYSYGGSDVNRLDGDCRMLDIPLNIYYYHSPQRSFSLFGSIGFSSYLMFEENYTYDVMKYGQMHTYSKKVNNENYEWFKMVNLSIGMQKRLTQRLILQAEPFVKVPLAGIGDGSVRLVSTGAFIYLKYHF